MILKIQQQYPHDSLPPDGATFTLGGVSSIHKRSIPFAEIHGCDGIFIDYATYESNELPPQDVTRLAVFVNGDPEPKVYFAAPGLVYLMNDDGKTVDHI